MFFFLETQSLFKLNIFLGVSLVLTLRKYASFNLCDKYAGEKLQISFSSKRWHQCIHFYLIASCKAMQIRQSQLSICGMLKGWGFSFRWFWTKISMYLLPNAGFFWENWFFRVNLFVCSCIGWGGSWDLLFLINILHAKEYFLNCCTLQWKFLRRTLAEWKASRSWGRKQREMDLSRRVDTRVQR